MVQLTRFIQFREWKRLELQSLLGKKMDKQGKEYPIYLQQLTPTTSKKVTMIELSGD